MTRKVNVGPAEPVYLTNASDISINTGDITLGDVGVTSIGNGVDVAQGATTDAAASSSVAEDTTARTGIGLWKGIKNILILINAKFGSLGQKTMAGSAPVVLASDQSALAVDATGQGDVPVTLDGEEVVLGAGTAAIGKLAANSGVDIGDVDVASIAAGDNNIGNVDLASAIPSGTNLIGKTSVGQDTSTIYNGTTALTPKFAAINVASSGDNTIVAAVVDKKIRVLQVLLTAGAAVNVRFEDGAGGTALTGIMEVAANGGFVLPFSPVGWFETGTNTILNLELSAAQNVDGIIVYVEV